MVPDGRTEWTDGRTHGRRQNYIPPTSSGDKKPSDTTTSCEPNEHIDPEPDTKEEPPAAEVNHTRFKKLTDGELDEIEANQYSAATRRNTQWGVRVFNGT